MSVEIHVMKIESLKLNCNKQRFSPQLALQGVRGKKHLVNVANSPFNCFLSCLAYYYLKKSCGVAVKQNLEDAAENFEAYKQFIYSLDYSGTKIEQPYDKPVSIKDMKIILAKNIKILGHIKVNLFGLVTMWRKAKIYAHELNMGNKRDECKFFSLKCFLKPFLSKKRFVKIFFILQVRLLACLRCPLKKIRRDHSKLVREEL